MEGRREDIASQLRGRRGGGENTGYAEEGKRPHMRDTDGTYASRGFMKKRERDFESENAAKYMASGAEGLSGFLAQSELFSG